MAEPIFSEQEIRSKLEDNPDAAAIMVEANKLSLDRKEASNSFKGPIYVAVIGALVGFAFEIARGYWTNAIEKEKAQAEMIQEFLTTDLEQTKKNLQFLLDAKLIDENKYQGIVDIAARTEPSAPSPSVPLARSRFLAILGSDITYQEAQDTVRNHFSNSDVMIVKKRTRFRTIKTFETLEAAQTFIDQLEGPPKEWDPHTAVVSEWCPVWEVQDGLVHCN